MVEKNYYNFTTPIGRLVSGAPASFRTTTQAGEPLYYKTGQRQGEPKRDYSIGVAFQKDQVDVPAFIRTLKSYAAKDWPNLFDEDLNCQYGAFADKITDGDSTVMNKKQRRPSDKPEWKGCWIIWFSSDREPQCVSNTGMAIDADNIKTGYYIRVKGSACKNTGDTPGMYMNLEGVELSGYGPELSNKPDVREAFKENKPAAVPEGMSTVPVVKGDVPIANRHPEELPPPPPAPRVSEEEHRATGKVSYQGVIYGRDELLERGWTEAQVAALPQV